MPTDLDAQIIKALDIVNEANFSKDELEV